MITPEKERAILGAAIMACTTGTPRIVNAVIKSQRGLLRARRAYLREAIAKAEEIVAALKLAQTQLRWDREDAA